MRVVLVMQQLLAVIEHEFRPTARSLGLTSQDLVVLGWLVDRPGISGSLLADRVGRDRSNVQRTLERFEREGLAERWQSAFSEKTGGWAPTEEAVTRWRHLEAHYQTLEGHLVGTDSKRLVEWMEEFMRALVSAHRGMRIAGMKEVPQREIVSERV